MNASRTLNSSRHVFWTCFQLLTCSPDLDVDLDVNPNLRSEPRFMLVIEIRNPDPPDKACNVAPYLALHSGCRAGIREIDIFSFAWEPDKRASCSEVHRRNWSPKTALTTKKLEN